MSSKRPSEPSGPVQVMRGLCLNSRIHPVLLGTQVAERLGNRAINQKVAGSIPGYAK